VTLQIVAQALVGPPVGDHRADLAHNKGGDLGTIALHILPVDAGVAHVGDGHADDLSPVGWIGDDLLVAGQAGVKDNLTHDCCGGAEGATVKDAAIGQRQGCVHNDSPYDGSEQPSVVMCMTTDDCRLFLYI